MFNLKLRICIKLQFIFKEYRYRHMTCYYMTKDAFNKLSAEIDDLEYNVLPVIVNEVSTARGNGDLSENAEYHAAKDKQRATMKKIGYLKDFKVNAKVVDCSDLSTEIVKFGLFVEILNLDNNKKKKIRLVGDYEADVENGLISVEAQLGKALLGKKVGDIIEYEVQDDVFLYKILNITNK